MPGAPNVIGGPPSEPGAQGRVGWRQPSSGDVATGPAVAGTLDVRVLGERRQIPFRLDGARVAVATITVGTEMR